MPAEPTAAERTASVVIHIHGHELTGQARNGVWSFHSPTLPEVAARWSGDTGLSNCLREFRARATGG